MHIKKALAAFRSQKSGAASRGIEFKLTFQQWCDFWGADIDRRGTGSDDLQMQRYGDLGGYEIGNIKKGTPKQNSITAGIVGLTRRCTKDGERLQKLLDESMRSNDHAEPNDNDSDEAGSDHLGIKSSLDRRYTFLDPLH